MKPFEIAKLYLFKIIHISAKFQHTLQLKTCLHYFAGAYHTTIINRAPIRFKEDAYFV